MSTPGHCEPAGKRTRRARRAVRSGPDRYRRWTTIPLPTSVRSASPTWTSRKESGVTPPSSPGRRAPGNANSGSRPDFPTAGPAGTRRRRASPPRDAAVADGPGGRSAGREVDQLGQAKRVAGDVAEASVDAVGPLLGRLGELDAPGHELVVGGLAVVRGQEHRAGEALGGQRAHLIG